VVSRHQQQLQEQLDLYWRLVKIRYDYAAVNPIHVVLTVKKCNELENHVSECLLAYA